MTTVAVTGASSPVGKALLERLDADDAVERIIGVDIDEPEMPVAKLEFRTADMRDRLLALAFEGADVVVHLAFDRMPRVSEDDQFARNVRGSRNVLAAAAEVGARRVVVLTDAAVYGAHPDNPVPLTEDEPPRANPDYGPGYQALLVEELLAEFDAAHPEVTVAVLRPAPVLGHGAEHLLGAHLEGPRLVTLRGCEPPLQLLHVDDLASALELAATGDLQGTYNVAADGWLAIDEVCTVLGKRRLDVPDALAFSVVRALWGRGAWYAPPGALHYLEHPAVLSAAKLRAAGWAPTRSNREVLREYAAEVAAWVRLGRVRARKRDLLLGGFAAAGTLVGLWWGGRRRR